jgi:hypothetical protein
MAPAELSFYIEAPAGYSSVEKLQKASKLMRKDTEDWLTGQDTKTQRCNNGKAQQGIALRPRQQILTKISTQFFIQRNEKYNIFKTSSIDQYDCPRHSPPTRKKVNELSKKFSMFYCSLWQCCQNLVRKLVFCACSHAPASF